MASTAGMGLARGGAIREAGEFLKALRRIVVQNALAAFADHDAFAALQFLQELRAQHDVAFRAAIVYGFGDGDSAASPANAFVVRKHRGSDAAVSVFRSACNSASAF